MPGHPGRPGLPGLPGQPRRRRSLACLAPGGQVNQVGKFFGDPQSIGIKKEGSLDPSGLTCTASLSPINLLHLVEQRIRF